MSYPRYVPHTTGTGKWDNNDINAVVTHVLAGETVSGFLAYPYSYLVRALAGGIYDAIDATGTRVYGGPDDAGDPPVDGHDRDAVEQACIDALEAGSGGLIVLAEVQLGTVTYDSTVFIISNYHGTRTYYNNNAEIVFITMTEWNAQVADRIWSEPYNFLIRLNGADYEAISGETKKVIYGGADDAGGVNGANAAAVIQAAIDHLPTNSLGGPQGVIRFVDAIINITDTLNIPAYSKIILKGATPLESYALQWESLYITGGTLLRWTKTGGGDIINVPASGTHSEPYSMCSWLEIENMGFRYTNRSYIGKALNLTGAYGWRLKNVTCDVEWNAFDYAPVAGSIGIYCPYSMNERRFLDNVVVWGYSAGYYFSSDHLHGTSISAYYCDDGVTWGSSWGVVIGYIHTLYCKTHIRFMEEAGALQFVFSAVEFEYNTAVPWITSTVYGFGCPEGGYMYGKIGFLMEAVEAAVIGNYQRYDNPSAKYGFDIDYSMSTVESVIGKEFAYINKILPMTQREASSSRYFNFHNGVRLETGGDGIILFKTDSPLNDQSVQILDSEGNTKNLIAGKGLILRSPNGTYYKLTVSDAGALVIT